MLIPMLTNMMGFIPELCQNPVHAQSQEFCGQGETALFPQLLIAMTAGLRVSAFFFQ